LTRNFMKKTVTMKNRSLIPLLLSLSLLLASCGGGGDTVTDAQTFSSSEKAFVNELFHTEYLWYDDVANIDYNAYDAPQALIDALKVPQDRWSFSITETEYDDMVNQKTAGFGFGYVDDFQVYLVRLGSPADGNLRGGERILTVDGETATEENIAAASQNLNVSASFTVLRNGSDEIITMTPREYTYRVTDRSVLSGGSKKVGYMRYDSFTGTSFDEFEKSFSYFKSNNIDELVIDLRYNGGGSVEVASSLLDNISSQYPDQRQVYLDWNENYKQNNSQYAFESRDEQDGNELKMKRVIFLVTQNSASASELVISALKPYLGNSNVITIGDYTHGKPVGMSGRSYGSNIYFLINFEVKNNKNESTPLEGIPPTCTAEDDLTHLMGDPDETMLKTALHYIDTGSCL